MIEFLVKRPIAVFMTFFAFVLLGTSSLNLMPISLMPEIDVPFLEIQIDEPNYSSRDLEKLIVSPIRRQLLQVSKLENIESRTSNGRAIINLQFEYGFDTDYAFIEVNEKIDRILGILPKDIDRPKIIKSNPSDIPLFYVNIPYSKKIKSKIEFSKYVDNIIRKRLEQISSVAYVDITGTVSSEMVILLKKDKLDNLNISLENIEQVINSNNIQVGSFKIKNGHYVYDILFEPSLTGITEIENLYIETKESLVQLKEIAEISLKIQTPKGFYYNGNHEGICLAVVCKSGSKIEKMKSEVLTHLELIQKNNPNIEYSISQDQTTLLEFSINNLKNSLIIGAFLAFLMVLLFIKNFRISLIIGIVIPFSLIISFLFLHLLGITINVISLSGLIVGIGMMIDNSIIVIDNISQYREKGFSIIESCSKGTYEIIRPLLSSLLTTCSVFIPLIYLSGISGTLFYDQSMAIIIGLSVSYLVSIFLLPTLYALLKINLKKRFRKANLAFIYSRSFDFFFKKRNVLFILGIVITLFGAIVSFSIKKEKLPVVSYNDFNLNIDWNENIDIAQNKKNAISVINYLDSLNISNTNAYIGEQQFLLSKNHQKENQSQFYIKSKSYSESIKVKEKVSLFLKSNYPFNIHSYENAENLFEKIFPDVGTEFFLKVPQTISKDIVNIINKLSDNFPDAIFKIEQKKAVVKLMLNVKKLVVYNIDSQKLINKLKSLFGTKEISVLKNTNEYIPIVIKNSENELSNILNTSYIASNEGTRIPIKNLLTLHSGFQFSTIYANAEVNYVPIVVDGGDKQKLMNYIKTSINNEIEFGGSYFENEAFIMELIYVLSIAVLLLYFILAAQFESVLQPLIILCEIPVTIGGTLIVMKLIGLSLNIMTMIGMIIMLGIVINDSILKIDTINKIRADKSMSLLEAIHKAGSRRLNAILMTSLTTILAMVPIVFTSGIGADLQKPLAIVVIISMLIGTFVSIYFVPLIYWVLTKNNRK